MVTVAIYRNGKSVDKADYSDCEVIVRQFDAKIFQVLLNATGEIVAIYESLHDACVDAKDRSQEQITMTILETVEIDHSAPSVHSGYDRETNRKLDTLFANMVFEDSCADHFGYERASVNDRAEAATRLYNDASEEAALAQESWRSAMTDDYDSTVQAASFYTQ